MKAPPMLGAWSHLGVGGGCGNQLPVDKRRLPESPPLTMAGSGSFLLDFQGFSRAQDPGDTGHRGPSRPLTWVWLGRAGASGLAFCCRVPGPGLGRMPAGLGQQALAEPYAVLPRTAVIRAHPPGHSLQGMREVSLTFRRPSAPKTGPWDLTVLCSRTRRVAACRLLPRAGPGHPSPDPSPRVARTGLPHKDC